MGKLIGWFFRNKHRFKILHWNLHGQPVTASYLIFLPHPLLYWKGKFLFNRNNIPCIKCNECPDNKGSFEGHDPCIKGLPGVQFACCGHGVEEGCHPYIKQNCGIFHSFNNPTPEEIWNKAIELNAKN